MAGNYRSSRVVNKDFVKDPNLELMLQLSASKIEVDSLKKASANLAGFRAGDTFQGWKPSMDDAVAKLDTESDSIASMYQAGDVDGAIKALRVLGKKAKKEYSSGDIGKMINNKAAWDSHREQQMEEYKTASKADKGFIAQRMAKEQAIMRSRTGKGYDPNFNWRGIGTYINVDQHFKDNTDIEAFKYNEKYIGTKQKGFNVDGKFVPMTMLKKEHGTYDPNLRELTTPKGNKVKAQEITNTGLVPNGMRWSYDRSTHEVGGYLTHLIADHVSQLVQNPGIISMYHHQYNELQGEETKPTFYFYRKKEKPYHIDYVFCSRKLLGKCQLSIGEVNDWITISDHMPLSIEISS